MSFNDIFKKGFLSSYANTEISYESALLTMTICFFISVLIYLIYYFKSRKYFFSREFAISLVSLSMITAAVILTIQSSIVVSLGMVGALSIVRFRTAIKNPLDLVFLFWSITIGIICGAGLYYLAVLLTFIVGITVLLFDEMPAMQRNKILVVSGRYPYDREKLIRVLKQYTRWWNIRTETVHNDEVNLVIELKGKPEMETIVFAIKELGDYHDVSLMKQEGIVE